MKQTGVSKIRDHIKNLKTNATIRNHSLFISWGMGVSEDFGENHTVFNGNRKGSEYNIVEREDSGKLTASGEGGRESDKFYWIQPKPSHPLPFLGNEE